MSSTNSKQPWGIFGQLSGRNLDSQPDNPGGNHGHIFFPQTRLICRILQSSWDWRHFSGGPLRSLSTRNELQSITHPIHGVVYLFHKILQWVWWKWSMLMMYEGVETGCRSPLYCRMIINLYSHTNSVNHPKNIFLPTTWAPTTCRWSGGGWSLRYIR